MKESLICSSPILSTVHFLLNFTILVFDGVDIWFYNGFLGIGLLGGIHENKSFTIIIKKWFFQNLKHIITNQPLPSKSLISKLYPIYVIMYQFSSSGFGFFFGFGSRSPLSSSMLVIAEFISLSACFRRSHRSSILLYFCDTSTDCGYYWLGPLLVRDILIDINKNALKWRTLPHRRS